MNRDADQFSVPVCNQWSKWQQLTAVYASCICFRAKLFREQFFMFYYCIGRIRLLSLLLLWWYRYVDDSHVCIAREHLTEFHSHLNSINKHIKFTVEEEKDGSIAFLDTMNTRNPVGTIKTRVYRKATHTDKYLQFNSHHPSQHKRSVARTLLDRAKNIPSTDADRLSEIQHVVDALKINGYTEQFIRSCQSTTVSTNQSHTKIGFVTLPYLQGISEKNCENFKSFRINISFWETAHLPLP